MSDMLLRMFGAIRDFFHRDIFRQINIRSAILVLLTIAVGGGLIYRLFMLQIVNGETYLSNFQLKIEREVSIASTRGNIYDRNGRLLAYNQLAYAVTMNDLGESSSEHDQELNDTIEKVIDIVEGNGDAVTTSGFYVTWNEEEGQYDYTVSGTTLLRFKADVYGYQLITDLEPEEEAATADEMILYLCSSSRFRIGTEDEDGNFTAAEGYEPERLLQIVTIRYLLNLNSYQKYIATTVAENVSEETVAAILENQDELEGVDISDDSIRVYNDSTYFSQIIGYIGQINSEELEELQEENPDYTSNDIVGKSGIEKSMETTLQGTKGSQTVYVDNLGSILEVTDVVDPVAGDDVYLTIDYDLQIAATDILEQKLADILVERIVLTKTWTMGEDEDASDIMIPIYDVYFQLFNNNVIDMEHMESEDAGTVEQIVYAAFTDYRTAALETIREEMDTLQQAYCILSDEYQDYQSYIVQMLKDEDVLDMDRVDREDEVYIDWTTNEIISMTEFLQYCIEQNWIDAALIGLESKYADSDETWEALKDYIIEYLAEDYEFYKHLYHYMIQGDVISGAQVCEILIEQGAVAVSDEEEAALITGTESASTFMINRISNLDITPAQLNLYPYSGSIVVTDVNTGEVLAMVSYPSYDNNLMSNGVDADYYASLQNDGSTPLINYATSQRTAPGSTFKMVSATAGLMEGVITTDTIIKCEGIFTKIGDPEPECWVYPNIHGNLDVAGAITNSCNLFFYEVGYRLGLIDEDTYDSDQGIEILTYYADQYGLTESSGIEIEEADPIVSTTDAVRSAIGQGSHSYTTVGLARYITTVANSGTCYNLTLIDKISDADGNVLLDNEATIRNVITMDSEYWDIIHEGMLGVTQNSSAFTELLSEVLVAGKTGTAQESSDRPNHALFLGYAPYDEPEIAIAVRVANGYTSSYAAQIAESVLEYYFEVSTLEEILGGGLGEAEDTD